MILKLQKRIDPRQLALVPEALALIQKQKEEDQRSKIIAQPSTKTGTRTPKHYGTGLYRPSIYNAQWKSLDPKPKKKEFNYY